MSDLKELYQELIIDHGRHPRNFGILDNANFIKEGFNPLCGDKITVYIVTKDSYVEKIFFTGSGCAISMASASLMTEMLSGKTTNESTEIFESVHQLLLGKECQLNLGKLIVLKGVAQYPARVKCATLAWHTMMAALKNSAEIVCTEAEEIL